jgi:hypothetical protein
MDNSKSIIPVKPVEQSNDDIINELSKLEPSEKFSTKDTIPDQIYKSLDWSKTVVGGSYALHQFTGDTSWRPHDVDIMIVCKDKDDFEKEAKLFEWKSSVTKIEEHWFDKESRRLQDDPETIGGAFQIQVNRELFHYLIIGSKTYTDSKFDLPIQLIGLYKYSSMINMDGGIPDEDCTIQAILDITTDIPSCVNYSIENGKKIFHIPEKGCEILSTGIGDAKGICPNRRAKYESRGYIFLDPEI